MKGLLLLALLRLAPPNCEPLAERRCTCVVQRSDDVRIRDARAIFVGRVVAVADTVHRVHPESEHEAPAQLVRVATQQAWKGAPADTTSVWLFTTDGLCGGRLAVGERWLFLLDADDRRLRIEMGACSNAIRIERAGSLLRALGPPGRDPAA